MKTEEEENKKDDELTDEEIEHIITKSEETMVALRKIVAHFTSLSNKGNRLPDTKKHIPETDDNSEINE